ncbi:MAG: hypothetical protein JWP91_2499 [Fibrobacteres bacterium]|nr:hypothetical protein [Fibrobacterota bacterium]
MLKSLIRGLAPVVVFSSVLFSTYVPARASTAEQADQAVAAFIKTYWNPTSKTFYKYDDKTGTLDFWHTAHSWETIMDAYARTGKEEYRLMIRDVYDGFVKMHGTDWTQNDYNDDIAWWVIACTHAYDLTGDQRYLTQAKIEFDWVYSTQRDPVKGGVWWKNTEHLVKNSCIVQPMIISAAKLARLLKDDTYRVKAESLYAWQKRTLVAPGGGQVWDNINTSGVISKYTSTYNQGTYIGSAVLLGHVADAKVCADWTKANMCNTAGILTEQGQGDVGSFKLILARYMVGLSCQPGCATYTQWMEANAAKVWSYRRTDGLMGHNWNAPAPTTGLEAQCAAGGVCLLNLLTNPTVSILPVADGMRARSGSGKVLQVNGDRTASIWLFSGATSGLRRPDGRIPLLR